MSLALMASTPKFLFPTLGSASHGGIIQSRGWLPKVEASAFFGSLTFIDAVIKL